MKLDKIKTPRNVSPFWRVTQYIPLEMYEDKYYLEHCKKALLEKAVKSYVDEVVDDIHIRAYTNKPTHMVELTLELPDLVNLAEQNYKLSNTIKELLDQIDYLKKVKI